MARPIADLPGAPAPRDRAAPRSRRRRAAAGEPRGIAFTISVSAPPPSGAGRIPAGTRRAIRTERRGPQSLPLPALSTARPTR